MPSKSMMDQFKDNEHKMLCMLCEANAERLDRLNGRVFKVIMTLLVVTLAASLALVAQVIR